MVPMNITFAFVELVERQADLALQEMQDCDSRHASVSSLQSKTIFNDSSRNTRTK
jgi:hypothetical protein